MKTILSLDIGGTSIKYGVFKEDNLIHQSSIKTNALEENFTVLKRIFPLIDQVLEKFEINGIAISTAGTVNSEEGSIIYANINLPNYTGTKLKEEIENKYKVPCTVENDVYCAALGEMDAQKLDDFYMVTIGTGVGGAVVQNNKLAKGHNEGAGRIAEIRVNNQRFEDIASTSYLVKSAKKLNKDEEIDGHLIFELAKSNEEDYKELIIDLCTNIIEGLSMINLIMSPKVFLLGGGIMEQKEFLTPIFNEVMNKKLEEYSENEFEIKFAALGNMAGIYGAYVNFKNQFFTNSKTLNKIEKGLIVSCQALDDEPLHSPHIMAKMALAAQQGGAVGIRAQGVKDIIEIKKEVDLPIIGIIKRDYDDSEIYITATSKEVHELLETECEIIAIDATQRKRPNNEKLEDLLKLIQNSGRIAMADCSTYEECVNAEDLGFDIISSTLFGYTDYSENIDGPNLKQIEKIIKNLDTPFIAEGKINTPEDLRNVFKLGSFSAVVGGAITRPQDITRKFVNAIKEFK